jgi:hypothetical protein
VIEDIKLSDILIDLVLFLLGKFVIVVFEIKKLMEGIEFMKKAQKVISLSMVFALLLTGLNFSLFSSKASAQSTQLDEEVEELANELEAIFGDSIIYDESGEAVGLDPIIIKKNIADTEYAYLADEISDTVVNYNQTPQSIESYDVTDFIITPMAAKKRNPKWTEAQNQCIINSLKANFGAAAVSGIYSAIKKGNWTDAATKLIKFGVKGSLPGLVISLGVTAAVCGDEASKKYPRMI